MILEKRINMIQSPKKLYSQSKALTMQSMIKLFLVKLKRNQLLLKDSTMMDLLLKIAQQSKMKTIKMICSKKTIRHNSDF